MELADFMATHFRGLIGGAFIKGWRARGITRLLPFQERTARAFAVETAHHGVRRSGRNALITAPTSAGKTLLAEIEIARHLTAGHRAAFLVPTRALAEQKTAEFARWLEPAGLRVVCATRERPETDRLVAAGSFDILVAVYEKMNHYLIAHPATIGSIGVVAVDEIQMVGDRDRGALLDLLLTKLRLMPDGPQLIGISAVVNRTTVSRLGLWLDAEIHEDTGRPRDLREGVLDMDTGIFTYKEGQSGEEATEWLAAPEELDRLARAADNAAAELTGGGDAASSCLAAAASVLARRGERVLVFAPTRRCSRHWAEWLSELDGGFGPAESALARLEALEPGRTRDLLRRCMERGVAFHNADLDDTARLIVEEAFNSGDLRAVVATPTLAMGVNLSARNVLHCPWRIVGGEGHGRTGRAPLGRARFCNQGGRAARLGMGAEFGRSILVAQNKAEVQRFWNSFIATEPEPLEPHFSAAHLPAMILDLLAGGVARGVEGLLKLLGETFGGQTMRMDHPIHSGWLNAEEVRVGLGLLARADFVRPCPFGEGFRPGDTQWTLTGLGEIAATLGLQPETVLELRDWLGKLPVFTGKISSGTDSMWIEPLFELALTAEGRRARSGLGAAGRIGSGTHDDDARLTDAGAGIARLAGRAGGLSRDESAALRASLALHDWIAGISAEEIESRHRVFLGSLARVAEEFEWLLRAASSLVQILGRSPEEASRLSELAGRMRAGVPAGVGALAQMRMSCLRRSALLRLAGAGLNRPELLATTPRDTLIELVGTDAAGAIIAALDDPNRRNAPRRERIFVETAEPQSALAISMPAESLPVAVEDKSVLLEINLRSPGVIRARGQEVALPPRSFDLLALLAERPGEVVSREAIYQRLWPEGGPEEQQIDGHRRTLIRRLEPALREEAPTIAEVIRGIGLRMTIPATLVSLLR